MVSVLLEFSLQGGSGKSQERGESPAEKLSQRETEQVQRWRDGAPPSPSHPGALLRAQLPSRTRGCPARFAGCHLHPPGSCSGEDLVSFQLLCAVLVGFCIFSDAGWSPPLFPGVVAGPPGCQEGARGGASHQSVPQVVQEKDGGNESSSVSALTAVWKGRDNLSRSPRGRFCTSCWGEVGIWTEGSMRASGGRGAGRGVVCAHRNLPALEFQSDQRGWQAEPPALMIFRSTHHHWGFS